MSMATASLIVFTMVMMIVMAFDGHNEHYEQFGREEQAVLGITILMMAMIIIIPFVFICCVVTVVLCFIRQAKKNRATRTFHGNAVLTPPPPPSYVSTQAPTR
uniref:Uncharacterized protein n=1 Tax=Ditylenchus dipsaci TaxID=166011 RepID=A0A915CXQ9_9BILA